MSFKTLIIIIFLIIFCTGCSSVQQRQIKQAGVLSTAINDSIRAGRFDRAKEFSDQLVKLTPPVKSKDRIKINEFKSVRINTAAKKGIFSKEELIPDKKFIVLPPGFSLENIVVKNDAKFQEVLNNNPILKKEEDKTNKIVEKSADIVDKILIDKEKELEKLQKKNSSWFGGIFQFFKSFLGIGIIGSVAVIVLAALFAPQLLPLIFTIIKLMFGWVTNIIIEVFKGLMGLFKK